MPEMISGASGTQNIGNDLRKPDFGSKRGKKKGKSDDTGVMPHPVRSAKSKKRR